MQRLLIDAHALAARWWDEEEALLMAPAGRHDREVVQRGVVGLLPPTVWWAYGLLCRGDDGDRVTALRALRSVVDRQYDVPGRDWHGSWPSTSREPTPEPGSVAFEDHDPNGRVLVGVALALVLRDHALPEELAGDLRTAVVRAVHAEPVGRVDASWTNIAAQLAWLELEAARWLDDVGLLARGWSRARAVVADSSHRGHVAEHVSPTYTGLTMMALSLWADRPPLQELAELGRVLRDEVWHDLLAAWHPGLGTLVPPFTRAFGMDLREHVGAVAPWLAWLVDGAWPFPVLDADVLHQGHHLALTFVVDGIAGAGEDVMAMAPLVRAQPARQGSWTDEIGPRRWSGWTGATLAVGAESSGVDWDGWWQVPTAAAIWRAPDGSNAWLRLHQDGGPVEAHVASDGRRVSLVHAVAEGRSLRLVLGGGTAPAVVDGELRHGGRRWRLAGVGPLGLLQDVRGDTTRTVPDGTFELCLTTPGSMVTLSTLVG
ncbi:MAG: hypothetical protein ACI9AD_001151 [Nitriliruptoraceae bacterium]